MPQRVVCVNGIVVPAAHPCPSQITFLTEIGDDSLDRPFGDPNPKSDIPGSD